MKDLTISSGACRVNSCRFLKPISTFCLIRRSDDQRSHASPIRSRNECLFFLEGDLLSYVKQVPLSESLPFFHMDSLTLDFRYLNWQVNKSVLLEQIESDYQEVPNCIQPTRKEFPH